ncbi:hypothetical protein [Acetobacterium carbinolicum]|uniref:hypothetical protein n=1 Tax=Acetobacterium carbinolicum TaxID=52690 RepID=UPI0039C8F05B
MAGIEQIKRSKATSIISDDGKDISQAYIMENETGEGAVSSSKFSAAFKQEIGLTPNEDKKCKIDRLRSTP